ncbi:MAG: TAXI family TRAP transporter solute-binding subunit [Sedimentitalea sp.]|nr:TAXI family TRAP transporter solute-binding subunit [Sedimentitalea sp.]
MIRAVLCLLLPVLIAATPAPAQQIRVFSVGSGNILGGYFATARAICDVINRNPHADGLRCSPEPTQGSIYNLAMLQAGDQDIALVQSDWQRAAYLGESLFAGQAPQSNLRSVMALYPETITILAGAQSDIWDTPDLFGRRVDIGPPASGRHASIVAMFDRLGIERKQFAELAELTEDHALAELCSGRVDAAIFILGHPSQMIARAMNDCGARMISLSQPGLRDALASGGEYSAITIPAGTYEGQAEPLESFAVYATVVTRSDVDDAIIETFVASVLDNRRKLAATNPLLAGIDPTMMRGRALTAPLHPAALRAFEAGGS